MQPNRKQILRAVCVASLAIAARNSRADNLWLNSSHNGLWDTGTSHNWQNPVTWTDNDNALFDSAGNTKVITLNGSISVANLTFNAGATGDLISGGGAWSLTLNNAAQNPPYPYAYSTITQNGATALGAQLQGSGGLFFTGTGTTTLLGDTNSIPGNQYTGGTYIHSGTVVLQTWAGSASTLGGGSWGIDSLEALDPGATLRIGIIDNGPGSNGGVFGGPGVTDMPKGLLGTPGFSNTGAGQTNHLHLTGGTLDLNGWSRNNGNSIMPCPDGTGLIINNSSNIQSALVIYGDGQDHTFAGSINDGGPLNITGSESYNDKGYQIGIIDLHYGAGGYVWTLAGTNTYTGSTRLGNGSIRLGNDGNGNWGTLGIPSAISGVTGPMRLYSPYFLDLNGTTQTVGQMTLSASQGGQLYNGMAGTVSTLNLGFGPNANTTGVSFIDSPVGVTGGQLALNYVGTGSQGLNGVNTYSGDTTLSGSGTFGFTAASAVSHNTSFKLTSGVGNLALGYAGSVNVRGLYLNGVRQPDGVYGAGTGPITGTGTLDVSPWIWNGAASASWNSTDNNWSSTSPDPTIASSTPWFAGREAVFGASSQKNITLTEPINAYSLTFNTAGYTINGNGNAISMTDAGAGINANASAVVAANITGNAGLTFNGTGTVTLQGDGASGNTYTGNTYVRKGTVILQDMQAQTGSSISNFALANIQAIDSGALVQIGTVNDGQNTSSSNVRPPDGQILRGANYGSLNLTGGTFDNNGDNNGMQYPPPTGTGTIVNSSPYARAVMKLASQNSGVFEFDGQIKDGGSTIAYGYSGNSGTGYQQNIDMNGGNYTLVLGGSNSFTGFLRLSSSGHTVILKPGGTLGYAAPINCPSRQILMNSGKIDLNGTSQKVGYVYTGNDANSSITNSAFGTTSTFTVCYNCTNTVAFNGASTPRGIRCALQDNPATGGTLALTKEGVAIQPVGDYAADNASAGPNNYHGDTTVNNGILEMCSLNAVSPNSTFRLNTTAGKLQLDFSGSAPVSRLVVDGVEQPNGTYSSATTSAITGPGSLVVTGSQMVVRPTLNFTTSATGGAGGLPSLSFNWSGAYKLQAKTNSLNAAWADYTGGANSPVTVTVDKSKNDVFFRLAPR